MGDYFEEQECELQALEAIYTCELTVFSTELPISFKILIETKLNSLQIEDASVTVTFTFPFNYPDVIPEMEVVESENVSEEHLECLLEFAKETAEDNIGTVMTYTLVSAFQEKLVELIETGAEEVRKGEEEIKRIADEAEMKRLEGTKVTVESFLKWKEGFDAEMAMLERVKGVKEDVGGGEKKLSGRELFMKDHDMDDSDIRMLDDGSEVVEVDESLFEDFNELTTNDDNGIDIE